MFAQNRERIAAVLCDIVTPTMDGPSTIRANCRLEPIVPIIATSGLMEERAKSAKQLAPPRYSKNYSPPTRYRLVRHEAGGRKGAIVDNDRI